MRPPEAAAAVPKFFGTGGGTGGGVGSAGGVRHGAGGAITRGAGGAITGTDTCIGGPSPHGGTGTGASTGDSTRTGGGAGAGGGGGGGHRYQLEFLGSGRAGFAPVLETRIRGGPRGNDAGGGASSTKPDSTESFTT